eukprot:3273583-Pleurochrysis_carterae.AAC.2
MSPARRQNSECEKDARCRAGSPPFVHVCRAGSMRIAAICRVFKAADSRLENCRGWILCFLRATVSFLCHLTQMS